MRCTLGLQIISQIGTQLGRKERRQRVISYIKELYNAGSLESSGLTDEDTTADIDDVSSVGFIYPVPSNYSITTGWYYSNGSLHGGVDIACPAGTSIYAVADGTVTISKAVKDSNGNYTSYGNYVQIKHKTGLYTLYAHMQKRNVAVGDTVKQGQIIGLVDSTGNSTGNHLHFEVRTGSGGYSDRVKPQDYLPSTNV